MKGVGKEKMDWMVSMFVIVDEERQFLGEERFQTLFRGWHWKRVREKRVRWVRVRNMIRPCRISFILLKLGETEQEHRQIDNLHVASAMEELGCVEVVVFPEVTVTFH